MRPSILALSATLGLAAAWPRVAAAQDARDFVFTYEQDHLILRFAGAQTRGMSESQRQEVSDSHVSIMVHDRLDADASFEAEPLDSAWAKPMQAELERYLSRAAREMSAVSAACRSASCRLVFAHAGGQSVREHEHLMEGVQRAIEAFIAADPGSFEPVFLLAGHYKGPEKPSIKVYLDRQSSPGAEHQTAGG